MKLIGFSVPHLWFSRKRLPTASRVMGTATPQLNEPRCMLLDYMSLSIARGCTRSAHDCLRLTDDSSRFCNPSTSIHSCTADGPKRLTPKDHLPNMANALERLHCANPRRVVPNRDTTDDLDTHAHTLLPHLYMNLPFSLITLFPLLMVVFVFIIP